MVTYLIFVAGLREELNNIEAVIAIARRSLAGAATNPQDKNLLDDYRSFRQVVRNVYTYNLDSKRVTELVDKLPDVFATTKSDLNQFFAFLDAAAQTPVNDD